MTPEGWRDLPLSDLATIVGGGTPSRRQPAYWDGDVPWATPTDVTGLSGRVISETAASITNEGLARSSATLLPPNSLLMTTRATIGACAVNRAAMATNQGFQNLVPKQSTSVEFLYYLIQYHKRRLERLAAGSTFLEVSKGAIRRFQVAAPPLPEQRKIAAILSSLDDAIEKTQAVIDQVQVVKRGLMQELLTRGLPGRHTRFKQTEIGEIPEEWDMQRLGDVSSIPTGQVDPTDEPYATFPLVAPNHIESKTGHLLGIQTAAEQRAVSGKYLFEPGDVLYSKIRPYLEKAVVATLYGLCSADMYPLRPRDGLESKYLLLNLLSQRFTDFANSLSTRTGIPKINREQLGSYRLAIPSRSEQFQIAQVIDDIDRRFRAESSVKERLAGTKAALMSVLLTGELPVNPDTETT